MFCILFSVGNKINDFIVKNNNSNIIESKNYIEEFIRSKFRQNVTFTQKNKVEIYNDSTLQSGLYITKSMSLIEKNIFINKGFIFNTYETVVTKIGKFIILDNVVENIIKNKTNATNRTEETECVKKIKNYLGILKYVKTKEHSAIIMNDLFEYLISNSYILDKHNKLNKRINEKLHKLDEQIEKDQEYQNLRYIFDPKKYLNILFENKN
jgi:hypothetical protein